MASVMQTHTLMPCCVGTARQVTVVPAQHVIPARPMTGLDHVTLILSFPICGSGHGGLCPSSAPSAR